MNGQGVDLLDEAGQTGEFSQSQDFKGQEACVKSVRFIDLFAGLGGTRIGFEQAFKEKNIQTNCVFSSEIKDHAISAYQANFNNEDIYGDITAINPGAIPDFDFLLAGFPCQPFSSAGKRRGFLDERGGLFFTILKILVSKKPEGFLLENVEGLVSHNRGDTLAKIVEELGRIGYHVSYDVLDASDFGVPQKRKRIYIVGHRQKQVKLSGFRTKPSKISDIIEHDAPHEKTAFTARLEAMFSASQLRGKAIKDKRGGRNNIHSWDLELKGPLSAGQKDLMCEILKKRRYKKWAEQKGIQWMDGMPLTYDEISTFYQVDNLLEMLEDLTAKGYLTFEHPRDLVVKDGVSTRVPASHVPKGYNIVAGKLSFPITKILDPDDVAPTLVATETGKLALSLKKGVRKLTVREGLRISGFPESYSLDHLDYRKAFDLIGNTVMPPVIKAVMLKVLS